MVHQESIKHPPIFDTGSWSCHWIALQCKWIIRILPYYFTSLWNYLEWNGICELNLIHPIVSVPRAPWVFLYTHSHHMWCPCDDMCGLNMDLWKTTHLAFKKQQLPRAVFRAIHIYSNFTEKITRHLTVIRIAYAIFWPNGLATVAYRVHYTNVANHHGKRGG